MPKNLRLSDQVKKFWENPNKVTIVRVYGRGKEASIPLFWAAYKGGLLDHIAKAPTYKELCDKLKELYEAEQSDEDVAYRLGNNGGENFD